MSRIAFVLALVLVVPAPAWAQTTLEQVSRALGADQVKSLEIIGSGEHFAVGQSSAPGRPWPRFGYKSFTRLVNYDTASSREDVVRVQAENPPRGGGRQPVRGEPRESYAVSGEHAWNIIGTNTTSSPRDLAERQFQLWATPHGVVKAAKTHGATVAGNTIAFAVPEKYRLKATVDGQHLVQKIEGVIPSTVVGDLPVEIHYADYRDFGGVKFPTRIRQMAGGHPWADFTVTEVKVNAAADIAAPDPVRQSPAPYSRVASQMVADGVFYVTGGSHHSVAIEMKDHVIVVEGPLNDERATAVLAEVKKLVPGKPVKYVVNSHHHWDHAGGLRGFAADGVAVVTHEVNRAYFERAFATPATVSPDLLTKSGKKAVVEGVKDKRVLSDGTRTVEIHHIAGNAHDDGLLLVYLPKEKFLVQADAFTPLTAGLAPPMPASPFTVHLADYLAKLGLAVDQHLPLHGRQVPFAELNRTIGRQ